MADTPPAKRRHRLLTLPSGLLLFVCVFLPAVKSCDKPVYPYELPPVWPPYVLGLLIAITVLLRGRALHSMILATRVVMLATIGGIALLALVLLVEARLHNLVPVAALSGMVALLLAITRLRGRDELAGARVVIATGVLGITWFGLWTLGDTDEVLYGIYVSVAASFGLFLGGIEWRREIQRDLEPPPSLPSAVARE